MITLPLAFILLLLGLAVAGALVAKSAAAPGIIYGGSLAISASSLVAALFSLAATPSEITLPLGLPWIGAHFRLDPLAAFFLAVVGLGGAGASLYALGHGRHEPEPQRVLPFYPAFLAGLNLVVLAADAFSFLFAWELMSLASWALVMSHHREAHAAPTLTADRTFRDELDARLSQRLDELHQRIDVPAHYAGAAFHALDGGHR